MSDGLNRAQRTAVTTLSGPLLVLAGAGTGKTRVITFRIAELIRDGVVPSRILAVTFTNKAAREMKQRAMDLLKKGKRRKKGESGPEISTFHSLCVRILRRHAGRLGYSENFTIYDRGDQESAARAALRDIRVGHQKLRPSDLITMISTWKSAGVRPEAAERVAKSEAEQLGAMAYVRYQASLRASSAMDFDDLLLLTERLFDEHPEARFAEASRYDHLLIDEYQDTNALQYRIVRTLAERHRNLCVVGDDDQSIYGWRGAEVEHILDFQRQWPDATVVRLEENYRSSEWIIHLANTLIAHNKTRHDKKLISARGRGPKPRFVRYEDETHEAESVVAEIFSRTNRADEERIVASHIAILFRTNEQPRAFEQELRRAGVPYVLVGGQSFYDRKEVKDLVSYLRVLSNPSDEVSLLRIINTPSRGIGTQSLQTLLDVAVERGEPLWKVLPEAPSINGITPSAAAGVEDFRELIDEFRSRLAHGTLSELVAELIARINYKEEIQRVYKDPGEHESRLNAVEDFVNAVVTYERRDESPSLNGFLEESALSGREDDKDDDKRKEHAVTLMTLHSAKGLEFPIVFLVGLEEGLLPHKRSVAEGLDGSHIEEERRLAYVGVTRAREELILSLCKNRLKWGKLRPQIPSRFVLEMRGETAKAAEFASLAHEQFSRELAFGEAAQEKAETGAKAGGRSKTAVGTKGDRGAGGAAKAEDAGSRSRRTKRKREAEPGTEKVAGKRTESNQRPPGGTKLAKASQESPAPPKVAARASAQETRLAADAAPPMAPEVVRARARTGPASRPPPPPSAPAPAPDPATEPKPTSPTRTQVASDRASSASTPRGVGAAFPPSPPTIGPPAPSSARPTPMSQPECKEQPSRPAATTDEDRHARGSQTYQQVSLFGD